ncbi:MAG: hypothetical protein U0790_04605 [Isosphaeraceae bacterium]
MLRLPEATDFLVEFVDREPEARAISAISALKVQAHDSRLRERLADIVGRRDLPLLYDRFLRDFPGA